MKSITALLFTVSICAVPYAQERWSVGSRTEPIVWNISESSLPHYDHIEMSGEQMSAVVRYGVNTEGSFVCERSVVFPMLRTIPNNTHASLMHRFGIDPVKLISVNGLVPSEEQVGMISVNGNVFVRSCFAVGGPNIGTGSSAKNRTPLEITREFIPSTTRPALVERYTVRNMASKPVTVIVPRIDDVYNTDPAKGVDGSYTLRVESYGAGCYVLEPGSEPLSFGLTIQAYSDKHIGYIDITNEFNRRHAFVRDTIANTLVLETPSPVLDKMFEFAKLRASESIYKTSGGYMHGPGGESYYAAVWANDQAEYANPLFPFLRYGVANESAINSFRHFARFMNPEYAPIPSSIISEGLDIWNGAGDRGDAAMIAYGAARYALARADKVEAAELWPLIAWCLEYCHRKLNDQGVVASDTDELEGRFPAGTANLCTSSLYYDALLSAAYLGKELGKDKKQLAGYGRQAVELRQAIEDYFGSDGFGFHTYRYYDGNDLLRSWICIPLTVGIYDRAEGTVEALFSPRLWSNDGLLTQEGSTTYWDRSTLYALRGIYAAGYADKATEYLIKYSSRRLTGDHVPYAIEAYPEGSQRHLSAESALYCRVITEGLFGIRPVGFHSFSMKARLPQEWDSAALRRIAAFGREFDIELHRITGDKIRVIVKQGARIKEYVRRNGDSFVVELR